MQWILDMQSAPKDRQILILTNAGEAHLSKWLETQRHFVVLGHWLNIPDAEFPVGWCDIPAIPEHLKEAR
jgi:hypothetical protein